MNTERVLDKVRSASAVGISLIKLVIGTAQLVLCAATALLALGIAGLENRSLVVAGHGVDLWPASFFYVLSALQVCCAVQGFAMLARVLERAVEAIVWMFPPSTHAVQGQVSAHEMSGRSSARSESELTGLSDSQPVQIAPRSTEEPCR